MTVHFLATCFLIGISAASGVGPMFLLILNRSSLYGFWKGFATGLGAALADAVYFILAVMGALSIVESATGALLFMEGISSLLLTAFGIHLIYTKPNFEIENLSTNQPLILSSIKAFFLTLFNPFILLFFIFVNINFLPPTPLSYRSALLASLSVGGGSLTVLSLIAALGSFAGSKIKKSSIANFSRITGVIFTLIGGYLLTDFIIKLLR